ncbi:glycosyltransferase [Aquisphaera insulae]|uniref:glycosyltransferase n=1 Tax=Aquisphaera insulae TaxID=2712864 RepID=UPI0013EB4BB6|nr:glycosyltransferase [Aquisphaera insulae]
MRILFVHQNFPAQFGHIAHHLAKSRGWTCDFVTQPTTAALDGVRTIPYTISGGARETTHYFSRTFENAVWHAHAVYQACQAVPDLAPDLIVGHSGFGSTLYLPELFPGVPVLNYFEHFYHPHGSDLDFRPDFPPEPRDFLRASTRNAMILLDLNNCRLGYSPTHYQRSLFPAEYQPRIEVIFDGIETNVFHRRENVPRRVGNREIPPGTRIVTYVSRGFESMRGFDIFMRAARLIAREHPDVLFVVVGSDRVCYGGDEKHIRHRTFREHVMAQDDYDPSKFLFTGLVPTDALVDILSLSDLHIYLSVPFVLSWSLMNALACGCVVLASDTEPVREVIREGETGLLADFFDHEAFARRAIEVLREPRAFRSLGDQGAAMIREHYALSAILPKLVGLFQRAVSGP